MGGGFDFREAVSAAVSAKQAEQSKQASSENEIRGRVISFNNDVLGPACRELHSALKTHFELVEVENYLNDSRKSISLTIRIAKHMRDPEAVSCKVSIAGFAGGLKYNENGRSVSTDIPYDDPGAALSAELLASAQALISKIRL